jgi:hypothetical protein
MKNQALVQIWFRGDVGPASIEYVKEFSGNAIAAFDRFTKSAFKQFPNAHIVEVNRV